MGIPFPAGTGGVMEDRFEAILSVSMPLTGTLSFQTTGGAEYSKIEQTGPAAKSRAFQRPKGSLSLAWRPSADFDASIKLSRKVGQLSFGDFLASVALTDGNENRGNNSLEPQESWEIESQASRRLGPWGSVKLEFIRKWFSGYIDFFPLPAGGEARGSVGDADATRFIGTATIKLDPIGWRGAQFDVNSMISWLGVTDPFTGQRRPLSNNTLTYLDVDFRHDVPESDWAYGVSLYTNHNSRYSRLFEFGRNQEGPVFLDLFVEHKDVLGLKVNARAGNVLGATQNFERTVFTGPRPVSAIAFNENFRRRIGPIFNLTVSGSF